jgi:hypothetical protein
LRWVGGWQRWALNNLKLKTEIELIEVVISDEVGKKSEAEKCLTGRKIHDRFLNGA